MIVKKLFMQGKIVTVNQEIDFETAEEIAMEFEILCEKEEVVDVIEELLKEDEEDEVGVIDMLFPRLSKKQRTLIDITLAAIIFIVGMVILRF